MANAEGEVFCITLFYTATYEVLTYSHSPSACIRKEEKMVEMKLDPEHREENREAIFELLDFTVKSLMEVRRICELDGSIPLDEFDEKLNELSEKWFKHFQKKSLKEIITKRMIDMLLDSIGDINGN